MCFVSGGLAGSPRTPAGHRSLLALRWLQTQGLVHKHANGHCVSPLLGKERSPRRD